MHSKYNIRDGLATSAAVGLDQPILPPIRGVFRITTLLPWNHKISQVIMKLTLQSCGRRKGSLGQARMIMEKLKSTM